MPITPEEPKGLSVAQVALAGILLSALGGAGLGMGLFMWSMGGDMTNMTQTVVQMGKDVTSMSQDMGAMTGRTQVMRGVLEDGTAKMSGDLHAVRGGKDYTTPAQGIMGRDMNTMHGNVGTMTDDVGEMSRAMQQMDVLVASMNGSMATIRDTMNRVSYDMGKMVRPETIMTPFR